MRFNSLFKILIAPFAILFFGISNVFASDLTISRPYTNERVSGYYTIQWSIFNTGQSTVPYELRIKNANCSDGGTLLASGNAQNGSYSTGFNSSDFGDGNRCVSLCINNNAECTQKTFSIVNQSNQRPVITSNPSRLDYKTNEVFTYQAQAYDPDNDPIVFRLLTAPDFIYMSSTGYMTINNYMRAGDHLVKFTVADNKGGVAEQQFTLKVTQQVVPTPQQPEQPSSPTAQPTQPGEEFVINLNRPARDFVFKGETNEIAWELTSGSQSNIREYVLEYTIVNGERWNRIASVLPTINDFNWDVSDIADGDYQVRIRVVNKSGMSVAQDNSERFRILNEKEATEVLSIFGMQPVNLSEIEEYRPTIEANYVASTGGEILIDSVRVELDGRNITDLCSIDASTAKCELDSDLEPGEHQVEISVSDSNEKEAESNWSFTLLEATITPQPTTSNPDTNRFDFSSLSLDGQIGQNLLRCCGLLLFLLIAFFVVRFIAARRENFGNFINREKTTEEHTNLVDTYTPEFSAQQANAQNTEYDNFDLNDENVDFSIGDQNLDDFNTEYKPLQPVQADTQVQQDLTDDKFMESTLPAEPAQETFDTPPTTTSNVATHSQDIPDWLKGDISDNASPINADGTTPPPTPAQVDEDQSGSQLHDDFGLVPVDDVNGDDQKK